MCLLLSWAVHWLALRAPTIVISVVDLTVKSKKVTTW